MFRIMAWLEEISHLLHWRSMERAQMVEDLLCKLDDLRSLFTTHTKCQEWWPHAIIPVLGTGRQLDPSSSLAGLPGLFKEPQASVTDPVSKTRWLALEV